MGQKLKREHPQHSAVPSALPTQDVDPSPGTTVSRYGYQFEVPWDKAEKIEDTKLVSKIMFKSGQIVLVWDPSKELDRLSVFQQAAAANHTTMAAMYGADAASSNYDLLKAIYETTPDRTSLWESKQRAARDMAFLIIKEGDSAMDHNGVYFVRTGIWRGFQHGLPAMHNFVILELFDEHDRELSVWIGSTNKDTTVTQREINRIVQTLRPSTGVN